ncbi:ubiquitin ligase (cullin) of SCF [Malassezia obtusa]|uniref:Ubiquitin ligase (Cullin) of SCF n=1 Tax=Malassezia obtusa TaxID=76774 RepID=A0AAF0DXU4_9BASI|nr:ubiquitin ligase (cullin) of SCF [Malassezia obtusa]
MATGGAEKKPAVALPPSNDINATWAFLESGIEVMMARLTEGMSYERYMQLYTAAYNYCISSGLGGTSGIAAGAHLVGGELYSRIAHYFQQHLRGTLEQLGSLTGEALLRHYAAEWERYTNGSNFVHRLLIYLNRHWVKHEREEGRTDVHTIYTLALIQWKRFVFQPLQIQRKLTQAVLEQIHIQRDGGVIQSSLLKTVLDSFVSLGIDDTDATRINLDVYRSEFQQAFLEATVEYYRTESTAFVAHNSVTDYMKKAETRLMEEEDRVELYLQPSTRRPLSEVCREQLVTSHAPMLWGQFKTLLENEMVGDLSRMYALLVQIPNGLDPLREQFEAHVKAEGLESVARAVEETPEQVDPARYIHALLRVYDHNMQTIEASFQSEAGMIAALDKACRVFMNQNQATGASASKSPELLAKYVDSLLKKSNKGAEETSLETALDQAMVVFKYIEDRDLFQKFYSKFLARRLVTFASASSDAEESMIAKLKEVCGFEYTSKLQRMFTEIGLCRELNERFREAEANRAEAGDIDFYALVLANGIWPLQAPNTDFSVPTELQGLYERFKEFYGAQHSRRVLTWLWHLSSNDVHTTVLTFEEIAAATRLETSTLKAALLPLVKSKVLHELDDSYSLNMDFKSKKVRVNLQIPVRAEQKAESTEVMKTVEEDRKMLLQATIVRIMKARKTLKHNLLLPEVITQVQSRFQPRVPDIKKAIDALIEREFLQRVEGEKDVKMNDLVAHHGLDHEAEQHHQHAGDRMHGQDRP